MFISVDNNQKYKQFNGAIKKGNIIVLYHATWCPHCVNMKPAWNDFVSKCKKDNLNINVAEVESEHIPHINTSNDVEGFPTIKYYKSATSNTPYEGERNVDAFLKFAKEQDSKFKKESNTKSGYESDNEGDENSNKSKKTKKRTKKFRKRKTKRRNTKRKPTNNN